MNVILNKLVMILIKMIKMVIIPIKIIKDDHDSDQDDFQLLLKASPSAAPLRHRRDLQRSKTAQKVSGQFLKKLQWTKK